MITLSLRGVKDIRENIKDKLGNTRISVCREYDDIICGLDNIIERADLINTLADDVLKVTLPDDLIQKIYDISYYFED